LRVDVRVLKDSIEEDVLQCYMAVARILDTAEKLKRMLEMVPEVWNKAFKEFASGKTPLDLVIDGILTPDEAEYAYKRYLAMSKGKAATTGAATGGFPFIDARAFHSWRCAFRGGRALDAPRDRAGRHRGEPLMSLLMKMVGPHWGVVINVAISLIILGVIAYCSLKWLGGSQYKYLPMAMFIAVRALSLMMYFLRHPPI